jgi:hypothetical protein
VPGAATLAQAATNPLPVNSKAFGKGYPEHAAGWLEWITSIPASSNPLFDPDGTFGAVGQSGKVWYLVGTNGGEAERSLTVPSGTALFFPIVNFFWVNTPEYGDPPWSPEQEQDVRDLMAAQIDTAVNLALEIDGRPVRNVWGLRAGSTVGSCDIPPTDNIFGIPLNPGIHECVADGYWALLPPLSVGTHTIHFSGGYSYFGSPFALDVTYHITVAPRKKVVAPVPLHH